MARLMRQVNLEGITRRCHQKTTRRDVEAESAPDLVEREFTTDAPDRLWVADVTYIPTRGGFLYLAVVLDASSRRVVGWAMAGNLGTELVSEALEMAIAQRHPQRVIHHSDQGTGVHVNCLWQQVSRSGCATIDGNSRGLLR